MNDFLSGMHERIPEGFKDKIRILNHRKDGKYTVLYLFYGKSFKKIITQEQLDSEKGKYEIYR